MKITIENGDKKVVREIEECECCPFNSYHYCGLFNEWLPLDIGINKYLRCKQCKEELRELE